MHALAWSSRAQCWCRDGLSLFFLLPGCGLEPHECPFGPRQARPRCPCGEARLPHLFLQGPGGQCPRHAHAHTQVRALPGERILRQGMDRTDTSVHLQPPLVVVVFCLQRVKAVSLHPLRLLGCHPRRCHSALADPGPPGRLALAKAGCCLVVTLACTCFAPDCNQTHAEVEHCKEKKLGTAHVVPRVCTHVRLGLCHAMRLGQTLSITLPARAVPPPLVLSVHVTNVVKRRGRVVIGTLVKRQRHGQAHGSVRSRALKT